MKWNLFAWIYFAVYTHQNVLYFFQNKIICIVSKKYRIKKFSCLDQVVYKSQENDVILVLPTLNKFSISFSACIFPFYTPLKRSENHWFWGYWKGFLVWNSWSSTFASKFKRDYSLDKIFTLRDFYQ